MTLMQALSLSAMYAVPNSSTTTSEGAAGEKDGNSCARMRRWRGGWGDVGRVLEKRWGERSWRIEKKRVRERESRYRSSLFVCLNYNMEWKQKLSTSSQTYTLSTSFFFFSLLLLIVFPLSSSQDNAWFTGTYAGDGNRGFENGKKMDSLSLYIYIYILYQILLQVKELYSPCLYLLQYFSLRWAHLSEAWPHAHHYEYSPRKIQKQHCRY